jgi:hypothetical protein
MRNLLALAALVLIGFGGLGWYLGWYKIHTAPTADGHRQIEIDVDTNKIKSDVNKGENKVHDWLNEKNNTQSSTVPTTGTTTSFRPAEDGSFVFPGSGPTPPSGGPTLPTPK